MLLQRGANSSVMEEAELSESHSHTIGVAGIDDLDADDVGFVASWSVWCYRDVGSGNNQS